MRWTIFAALALLMMAAPAVAQTVIGRAPIEVTQPGCATVNCAAQTPLQPVGPIAVSQGGSPALSLNFLTGSLDPRIIFSRLSPETSGLYTDAAGAAYTTFGVNVPALTSRGFGVWQPATNYLLNSDAPATQTTESLATGTYTFFCNGTGSVTTSAGTATGSGFGTQGCSTGTFQVITLTGAGTITATVSGSVIWFDLQNMSFPTPHIVTAGTTATRSADVATMPTSAFVYNQNAGTLAGEFIAGPRSTYYALAQLDDGGDSNKWAIGASLSAGHMAFVTAKAGVVVSDNSLAFTAGSVSKAAMAVTASVFADAINGALGSGGAQGAPTGMTELFLGSDRAGTHQMDGWLRSIRYWPRALSSAQLQSLTQ